MTGLLAWHCHAPNVTHTDEMHLFRFVFELGDAVVLHPVYVIACSEETAQFTANEALRFETQRAVYFSHEQLDDNDLLMSLYLPVGGPGIACIYLEDGGIWQRFTAGSKK
jgi:hypothetical protein